MKSQSNPIKLSLELNDDALLLPHIRQLADEMLAAFSGEAPTVGP
jgi:hypothetical protein